MTRTCLKDRLLPVYTRGEEIFNMVTHIVGGGIGVITLALCIVASLLKGSTVALVSGIIFGVSMIALYSISSIYHGLREGTAKKVLQIIDHCTIYFLIAGTYTPMLLCALVKTNRIAAIITLIAVWGLTALAITLNAIDLKKYKVFSMVCYIGIGWAIIFSIKDMFMSLPPAGFWLLLSGGIVYTAGTIFYKAGKNVKYLHSVFHIFVVVGSILHALSVILFAL